MNFQTGDPEPHAGILILLHRDPEPDERRYLARFQHGWRWVDSRSELQRADKTPLSWRFATAASPDRAPVQLRTPTEDEHAEWLAS